MSTVSQIELIGNIARYVERHGHKSLCPRQINAIIAAADLVIKELGQLFRPAVPGSGLKAWLASDSTGSSSLYLAHVLAPQEAPAWHGDEPVPYPHDPSDFGRCVGLLDAAPDLRPRLPNVATGHGPQWAALAGAWEELEALYREELPTGKAPRLYARMQELLKS